MAALHQFCEECLCPSEAALITIPRTAHRGSLLSASSPTLAIEAKISVRYDVQGERPRNLRFLRWRRGGGPDNGEAAAGCLAPELGLGRPARGQPLAVRTRHSDGRHLAPSHCRPRSPGPPGHAESPQPLWISFLPLQSFGHRRLVVESLVTISSNRLLLLPRLVPGFSAVLRFPFRMPGCIRGGI